MRRAGAGGAGRAGKRAAGSPGGVASAGRRARRAINKGFEPVADALAAFLDRTPLGEALERAGAVDAWEEAAGPMSRTARAVEVRGRDLVVEVESSAWMQEMSMLTSMILERLNEVHAGPAIEGIRFRLAESCGKERK